jgi:hypothetical protein
MSWPLPNDFNEAVQTPATAFADPDLKRGQAAVGPTGMPLPRSGNFADVYQILGADGRNWAVKCFTRSVPGLDKRYDLVGKALAAANLPFTIPFTFLSQGIRVAGKWYPVLKMEWVDGLQLNQFVRENVTRPAILDGLFVMWTRLCKRLREAGLAHADLQHGNVLLVPGAKPGQFGLKLIDYDGLYAPALANTPSGELGHPAFQHPQRAAGRVYSPDLDRFPHLVVAAALKGLAAAPDLWERFDTGDNLLFTEDDFKQPGGSKLLKEMWATGNAGVQGLVGRLVLALGKPLPQTPWLDQIAPDGKVLPLPPADAQMVMSRLGFSLAAPPMAPPQAAFVPHPLPAAVPASVPKKKSPLVPALIALGGLLAVGVGAAAVIVLFGDKKPVEVAQTKPTELPTPPTSKPPEVIENPKDPDPAPPTPPDPTPDRPVLPPPRPDVAVTTPPPPAPAPTPDLKVVELKPAWSVTVDADHPTAVLDFTPTGRLVWAGPTRGVIVYDPKSGKVTAKVTADGTRATIALVSITDKGQVGLYQPNGTSLLTWDSATGRAGTPIDAKPVLADRTTGVSVRMSPNGRYLSASWLNGANNTPGGARVYDTVGKRLVLSADGRVFAHEFTPDSTRVLVVERGGRCRWFRLPSGTTDGEFTLGVNENAAPLVLDLTQGGDRVLVSAALTDGGGFGVHWVDGKTGKPVYSHLTNTFAFSGATDPGGRVFAHPHLIPAAQLGLEVQVYDADGKLIARVPVLPPKGTQIPRLRVAVSDDARRLFVLNPEALTLSAYDLPVAGGRLAVKPRADERLPVPPDETVTKAAADIRELYKAEFAKRSAADKKALAVKLLDVAADTKASADQYALLREARDLYADAGDVREVAEVAGLIADRFSVDRFAFKLPTLEKLAALSAAGPLREVAEWALAECDAEFAADRYAQAGKLASVAAAAARKANAGPLLADATDRTAQVKKAEEQFAVVKDAFDTLKAAPDDPAANLAVGRFRCLVQRRWADGIPHLAKGSDQALKAAAELDQSAATDRDLEAKAADAWAEYAKSAVDADRSAFEARSRHWAFRAMEVLTGLELEKARSKLVLTHGKAEYLPGLMREVTMKTSGAAKVPAEVADKLDFNPLDIKDANKSKLDFTARWTGVLVPPKPGRYKLEVRTGAAVKVRVNNTTVIDTAGKQPTTTATVTLADQPNAIVIDGTFATDPKHTLTLLWLPPGSLDWEPIPAEHLYHPKR